MPRRPNIINQLFQATMDTPIMDYDVTMRDDDDDSPSKKAKSGGRRKQSKPSRVCFEEGGAPNGQPKPDETARPDENAAAQDTMLEGGQRQEEAMSVMTDDIITCGVCSTSFSSQSELGEHMTTAHSNGQEADQSAFPTKYHRLGSELLQGSKVINIEPCDEAEVQEDSGKNTPDLSSAADDGALPKNGKIFHQDAYCDLCNREFCNKYFLKTHKANKHGIFDDVPSPIGSGLDSAFSAPSKVNGLSGAPTMVPMPEPPTILNVPIPTPQEKHALSLAASKPSTPNLTHALSRTPETKPTPSSEKTTPKKVSHDMEDYCEICQKHFCNKYYLRKHKHDVHGIIPDKPVNKRGRSSAVSSVLSTSSSTPSLSLPTFSTSSSTLPPHVPTSASNGNLGANLNSMANLMFINPFAPPVAIIQGPPMLQTPPHGFPPPGLAPMAPIPSLPSVTSSTETSPKSSAPSSSSPQNMSLPSDALRGMGVLNADAYCEICRKEFCNKYFLKVHKANKHGIFTDDLFPPPHGGQLLLPFMPPGSSDMPAALALEAAQVAHAQALAEAAEASAKHKENNEKRDEKESSREDFCDICKREFGSKYSLKIHQISVHGAALPGLPEPTDLSKDLGEIKVKSELPPFSLPGADIYDGLKSTLDNGLPNTLFGTMVAAKMADRVMCDICNKEVCNKYFLKTHKMKVHGIDPNAIKDEVKTEIPETRAEEIERKLEGIKRPANNELLKMGIDPEAYCELCRKEFCSKYFLKTHKLNIHGIKETPETLPPVSSPPSLPPPPPPVSSSLDGLIGAVGATDVGLGQHTWKWKEPVSTSRVMCEVCNKELCNKYFLKTHMLKRHGIVLDIVTGMASPAKNFSSSPMKEGDTNSTDSGSSSTKEMQMLTKDPVAMETGDASQTVTAPTWHVPQDYSTKQASPSPPEASKTDGKSNSLIHKCELCGMLFGDYVALHLHVLNDHKHHDGEIQKDKMMTDLGMNGLSGAVAKKRRGKYKKRIRNYLEKLNQNISGIGEKTKSAIMNHLQKNQKRRFRCKQCKERFVSRQDCLVHIRAIHGRKKPSRLAVQDCASQVDLLNGDLVPVSRAKTSDASALKMQAFNVSPQESGANFADAVVYLPVHEKISETMTISFTLTPTGEDSE